MNYAGNTEIIRKHFHDHQENLCIAVLSIIISFVQTILFLGYFYSRSFQKYSRTSVENSRTCQAYPTIFQYQGLFKDMMLFQGLFKARMNHALGDEHLGKTDTRSGACLHLLLLFDFL